MITKNNIVKRMFVKSLSHIDNKIQRNHDLQRAVFIAAYEEEPIEPIPEKLAAAGALTISIATLFGALNFFPAQLPGWALPIAMGCAGGFTATSMLMVKAFNHHAHKLAHRPAKKLEIIHGDHVNNLAEAYILGEYCHRSRNRNNVSRALSGIEGAGLLGPIELRAVIQNADYPAAERRLPRGRRTLFNPSGWH